MAYLFCKRVLRENGETRAHLRLPAGERLEQLDDLMGEDLVDLRQVLKSRRTADRRLRRGRPLARRQGLTCRCTVVLGYCRSRPTVCAVPGWLTIGCAMASITS